MITKILAIILLILVFITLIGAYDGVLAFFFIVIVTFSFVTWYYWEDLDIEL